MAKYLYLISHTQDILSVVPYNGSLKLKFKYVSPEGAGNLNEGDYIWLIYSEYDYIINSLVQITSHIEDAFIVKKCIETSEGIQYSQLDKNAIDEINLLREDASLLQISDTLHDYLLKKIFKELYKFSSSLPETTSDSIKDLSPRILFGPPGTGKTHEMQHKYIDFYDEKNKFVTTFHQSFSYEEFVEGLKATTKNGSIDYHIERGIFYKACERAAELAGYKNIKNDNDEILQTALDVCIADEFTYRIERMKNAPSVLLCIDEINRANVSAVFGDLISLIETSKRLGAGENEMTAILPYSKKKFGVPANLLIVGTMNTADRSIQLLDSALRRRFVFEELLPNLDKISNNNAQKILKNINLNICAILNKDHQIGHSYFIGVNNNKDIVRVMLTQVIPLLEEYFYNNTEKIKCVLGEQNESADCFYIEDKPVSDAYKKCTDGDDRTFYKLNETYLSSEISDSKADEIVNSLIQHLEN